MATLCLSAVLIAHCENEDMTVKPNSKRWDVLRSIIEERRTIREFDPEPPDLETLGFLRNAMDLAPSVGNSLPWRIFDASEEKDRQIVGLVHQRAKERYLSSIGEERKKAYCEGKFDYFLAAPVSWLVFTDMNPVEGSGQGRLDFPESVTHSTVCAIHTLWLAAVSHGLGMCWVTSFSPKEVESAFCVPMSWSFTALVGMGRPRTIPDRPVLETIGWQTGERTGRIYKGTTGGR